MKKASIIKRTIRDMLTDDVDEIHIEGKEAYEVAKKLSKNIVPHQLKNVKTI